MVVVAATLDPASERIVAYLADRGLPINVLFFQVYRHGETLLLGRSWLIDPVEVQTRATAVPARAKEPEAWNQDTEPAHHRGAARGSVPGMGRRAARVVRRGPVQTTPRILDACTTPGP